jgi:hypothetical protein
VKRGEGWAAEAGAAARHRLNLEPAPKPRSRDRNSAANLQTKSPGAEYAPNVT